MIILYEKKTFTISKNTISEESKKIEEHLVLNKISNTEIKTALLLLEELTMSLCENQKDDFSIQVTYKKNWGNISLEVSSDGEEYNPLTSAKDMDHESADYFRFLIFQANIKNLHYIRKNSKNIILIQIHKAEKSPLFLAISSMIFGICFGLLLKFIPDRLALFINDNILGMIQALFMNAVSFLITPIVFFSLTTSMSSFSGNEMGRVGLKFFTLYLIYAIAAIFIGYIIATPVFNALITPVPNITGSYTPPSNTVITVKEIMFNLIPSNLVTSMLHNNVLQVLVVSLIFAITLSQLGDRAQAVKNLFDEFDTIFMKLMMYVIFFMPLVAFSSLAIFTYKSSISTILSLICYFVVVAGGLALLFIIYLIVIAVYGHISPLPYMKKVFSIMPTAFIIPKRNAIFPISIDFCNKKLGASEKISCFSIPFGSTMNKCTNLLCATIELALFSRICEIPISGETWIKITTMMLLLAAGSNGLVTLITVMSIAGLPVSLISFVTGMDDLIGRMRNSLDVAGDIAATIAVASNEGKLNKAIYKEDNIKLPS